MEAHEGYERHLASLRSHRTRPDRDQSMRFVSDIFKHNIEKPHKQLVQLVELWEQFVPADMIEHTRLDGFSRGVLRVSVDSSARLYEIDGLLRSGLQRRLIEGFKGTLRRVQLRVASLDD